MEPGSSGMWTVLGILWVALAIAVAVAARNRNRSAVIYFACSLIFSPFIGITLLGISGGLSPSKAKPEPVERTIKCPQCAETIKAEARKCRFCGSALAVVGDPGTAQQTGSDAATSPILGATSGEARLSALSSKEEEQLKETLRKFREQQARSAPRAKKP